MLTCRPTYLFIDNTETVRESVRDCLTEMPKDEEHKCNCTSSAAGRRCLPRGIACPVLAEQSLCPFVCLLLVPMQSVHLAPGRRSEHSQYVQCGVLMNRYRVSAFRLTV